MKKKSKLVIWMIVLITVILIFFFTFKARDNIVTYVSKYTNALVEANVVNCLNNATTDSVNKYKEIFKDFLDVEYGKDQKVTLLTVNMLYVNCLQRDIASLSLEYLIEYCGGHELSIPTGAFLGSVLFSGMGRKMKVSLIPIGSTNTDYTIDYESVGVNSTRFSLYINVYANVRVAAPFYTNDVNVTTKVMVVESVIQGEVPPYLLS